MFLLLFFFCSFLKRFSSFFYSVYYSYVAYTATFWQHNAAKLIRSKERNGKKTNFLFISCNLESFLYNNLFNDLAIACVLLFVTGAWKFNLIATKRVLMSVLVSEDRTNQNSRLNTQGDVVTHTILALPVVSLSSLHKYILILTFKFSVTSKEKKHIKTDKMSNIGRRKCKYFGAASFFLFSFFCSFFFFSF